MLEAIAGVISIIVMLLGHFLKNRKPKSQGEKHEGDIEEMERAIVNGDADTISRLFRELRPPPRSGSNSSRQDDNKTP